MSTTQIVIFIFVDLWAVAFTISYIHCVKCFIASRNGQKEWKGIAERSIEVCKALEEEVENLEDVIASLKLRNRNLFLATERMVEANIIMDRARKAALAKAANLEDIIIQKQQEKTFS